MLHLFVLRSALAVFSALFGGFGIFFLHHSFHAPRLGVYALMFLGTATAIELSRKA